MEKTLVIMAAGMGSRYGGLKQMDGIGPGGGLILNYSIYDAVKAGFTKVIFIIKRENESLFREVVGDRVANRIPVEYVFQNLTDLPAGFEVPNGRVKPWGTGHAVLCAESAVTGPFAVINADDFYGRDAFAQLSAWIDRTNFAKDMRRCAMVGYILKNTLTENGHVSRGVCREDARGFLEDIHERTKIMRRPEGIAYSEDGDGWTPLSEDSIVSMNCWCFPQDFPGLLREKFAQFLKTAPDLSKAEFHLPFGIQELMKEGLCSVEVLKTSALWFGVTYREDRDYVAQALAGLTARGEYPKKF